MLVIDYIHRLFVQFCILHIHVYVDVLKAVYIECQTPDHERWDGATSMG